MKLLLNADDLGYSPAVNETIFDLHDRGRLSSASLIVNLPHSEAAMAGAVTRTDMALGLHLNLTRGAPCLPAQELPSLVSRNGHFYPSPILYARAAANLVDLDEARRELGAQIERALVAGLTIAHLDSHSHWHIIPSLRPLMPDLARKYSVNALRLADPRRTLMPSPLWLAAVRQEPVHTNSLIRSDYLFTLSRWLNGGGEVAPTLLGQRMRQLLMREDLTVEMVLHPGHAEDPDFPADTLPAERRAWEYRFVLSERFDDWLMGIGGDLV